MTLRHSIMMFSTFLPACLALSAVSHANILTAAQMAPLLKQMTPQERHVIALETNTFKHGGYNEYSGGKLTLHALHGAYVLTYPLWNNQISPAYRKVQQSILLERLNYESRLLAQMTSTHGGACIDPANGRPAIRNDKGTVVLNRTDVVPGSILVSHKSTMLRRSQL